MNINMKDKKCSVCSKDTEYHFTQTILGKYEVSYFYCDHCGFLQTEDPYWLEESYKNAIADADTGLVVRNTIISKILASILFFLFKKDGKYLDIAGGYGMLTRLMRDIGFDFYWSDPYCQNLLSKGFELSTTTAPFDVVTAFEVLEHVHDPVEFIKSAFSKSQSSTLIFSTELFFGVPPKPSEWYYYLPETGQHISFYQLKTLQFIADKLSLNLYSRGFFHILTNKKNLTQLSWTLFTSRLSILTGLYVKLIMKSKSKTFPDHYKMRQNIAKRTDF
jgi:Methyltransferase domain